jgi:hypothetical protein
MYHRVFSYKKDTTEQTKNTEVKQANVLPTQGPKLGLLLIIGAAADQGPMAVCMVKNSLS